MGIALQHWLSPQPRDAGVFPVLDDLWSASLFSLSLLLHLWQSRDRRVPGSRGYSLCGFLRGIAGWGICLLRT